MAPILKKGPEKSGSHLIVGLVICQLLLSILASPTQAQVVIVGPKSGPPAKAAGKGRPRPKTKSTSGADVVTSRSKTKKSAPASSASQGAVDPSLLGFSIVKPSLDDMTPGEKTAGAGAANPPASAAPDEAAEKARKEQELAAAKAAEEAAARAKREQELAAAKAAEDAAAKAKQEQELAAAKTAEVKTPATPVAAGSVGTALFPSLIEFGYEVISSDVRGKVSSTNKKTARYFSEKITGGVNIELVEIPGGSFSMGGGDIGVDEKEFTKDLGSQAREKVMERLPAESPRHNVAVPTIFMGKLEVTQAQWMAVARLPQVKRFLLNDPSQFKGADLPVERVSWDEAVEFCERLSRATGRKFRLPTEAEWEYAARAGTDSPFHYGSGVVSDWANFDGDKAYLTSSDSGNRGKTVVAGSLGAGVNAFGLYDMHGNVWEWCQDNWHENYQGAPTDGSAWRTGGAAYLKVLRGGGWDSPAVECRVSFRDRLTPTLRINNVGFRVVVEAAAEPQSK